MLSFARIVYGFKLLNIVPKLPILHVCGGPSYASDYFRIKYDDKTAYLFPEWLANQVYSPGNAYEATKERCGLENYLQNKKL